MARRILARNHRRIADILAGERAVSSSPAARATVSNITYSIADVFAQSSQTFDRDKFYEVAGQPELSTYRTVEREDQLAEGACGYQVAYGLPWSEYCAEPAGHNPEHPGSDFQDRAKKLAG